MRSDPESGVGEASALGLRPGVEGGDPGLHGGVVGDIDAVGLHGGADALGHAEAARVGHGGRQLLADHLEGVQQHGERVALGSQAAGGVEESEEALDAVDHLVDLVGLDHHLGREQADEHRAQLLDGPARQVVVEVAAVVQQLVGGPHGVGRARRELVLGEGARRSSARRSTESGIGPTLARRAARRQGPAPDRTARTALA